LLGSRVLADFDFGANPQAFLLDFGFGVVSLVSFVFAVLLPAQHWFDLTSGGQIIPLLARPVSPFAILLGSFLGSLAALAGVVLALSMAVAGLTLGAAEEIGRHFGAVFLQGWLFWCRAAIIAAVVYFFGSYVRSRTLGILLAGFIGLGGQLTPLAAEWAESAPASSAAVVRAVLWIVPDLSVFHLRLEALLMGTVPLWGVVILSLYSLTYVTLLVFLGGLILRRRTW
jgi:ABC-type transport system involved in multi-copper enzyme maturation permease subunit